MTNIETITRQFSEFMWGYPVLILLIGGGLYFLIYSGMLPFRHIGHALRVLSGRYNDPNDPGEISHYQAVSTALASTIGMGNISGVAVAIAIGGPGAIFWMWVSAIVGAATQYFTCTLSVMYRWKDKDGNIHGGPMYFITDGLGKKWKPLAILFSLAGMIGVLPLFQVNQLTQAIREIIFPGKVLYSANGINLLTGAVIVIFSSLVIFGGVRRIGSVAGKIVPAMTLLYFLSAIIILIDKRDLVLPSLLLIFRDAFTGNAVLGGSLGQVIIIGVRRGTFSHEAGIGTSAMAHGAARTREPAREGLVAMIEPIVDTVIVCTLTALVVIVTGVWKDQSINGITMTNAAFESVLPGVGRYILMTCVFLFAFTTLFAYPYYGSKCFGYVFGESKRKYYNYIYLGMVLLACVVSIHSVINLVDGIFALMAIPTMTAGLLLSGKVMRETKRYFGLMKK
ncbi:MAG TPA: sodium:alanine symporter family protein [Cyclobacteriaceae bacterium]|nr:sodium:alanine symporter family protein [Cyclobacteriaceae bacterium]